MDLAKMKKKAAALLGKASRGDWLMVRKNISVRDEYYRKSAPDKTLWHDDMEVEFSLCIALVTAKPYLYILLYRRDPADQSARKSLRF